VAWGADLAPDTLYERVRTGVWPDQKGDLLLRWQAVNRRGFHGSILEATFAANASSGDLHV